MYTSGPMPFPTIQTERWLYRFVDDLSTSPLERGADSIKGGGQSSVRVAIRMGDHVIGAMNVTSRDPAPYTVTDLAVFRRIADYVAIALSHQRLAEEARLGEQLRARAANLELLDELLGTLSDGGELDEVLDRISALSRKVLPHHAACPPGLSAGRPRPAVHEQRRFCRQRSRRSTIDVPAALRAADWEFDVIDDTSVSPAVGAAELASKGFQSALRLPARLEGRVAAALAFLSRRAVGLQAGGRPRRPANRRSDRPDACLANGGVKPRDLPRRRPHARQSSNRECASSPRSWTRAPASVASSASPRSGARC